MLQIIDSQEADPWPPKGCRHARWQAGVKHKQGTNSLKIIKNCKHIFAQESVKVNLYCQAWAKNIDTERIYVDNVTTKAEVYLGQGKPSCQ